MTLPPQNTPQGFPPELTADCVRLAAEGLSQREIGIALGIFKSKVFTILSRAGVKTRFYNERKHGRKTDWEPPPKERPITLARVPSLEREEVA